METLSAVTELDILSEVVRPADPTFESDFAKKVLGMRLSEGATARIRELLRANNAGTLTVDERGLLDRYLLVGQFIDLLQAKARVSLATMPA